MILTSSAQRRQILVKIFNQERKFLRDIQFTSLPEPLRGQVGTPSVGADAELLLTQSDSREPLPVMVCANLWVERSCFSTWVNSASTSKDDLTHRNPPGGGFGLSKG
jgi:hypothetical protein